LAASLLALLPRTAVAGWAEFDRVDPAELDARRYTSIVYADQNLRSPASMFGHTFLVFHDHVPPEPDAPVVEFLGDASSFLSEVRAVFLGIPGRFRLSRFVFLQRTYDLEDRSLFVYQLELNADEKARLASLARDSVVSSWRYDFFRENCSYHVLALVLRSLEPKTTYSEFPFVVPAATIGFLQRQGRVARSYPLVSSLRRLEERYRTLSEAQRSEFEARAAGMRGSPGPIDPGVAEGVEDFVRYQAPREPDRGRRNALFQSAAALAAHPDPARAPSAPDVAAIRDPARSRATVVGFGWRSLDTRVVTATILPGVRGLENTDDDALRNSVLEIGRLSVLYRPGRFAIQQVRAVYLDAQQAGSRFSAGFTRYLDASFEKAPNKDWSLHDEYRIHFGGGVTVQEGPISVSGLLLTGPRYTASDAEHLFLWDVGVRFSLQGWIGRALRLRSDLKWTPLAPGDDQGVWSNVAVIVLGPVSLLGGAESPVGDPLKFRAVSSVNYAF